MSIEVHESVENAMFDLDFYILVGTRNGYPITQMSAADYAWAYSARDVRCYRKLGTAKSVRTRALKNVKKADASTRAYGRINKGIEDIRILHVHLNLANGTSNTEWVK